MYQEINRINPYGQEPETYQALFGRAKKALGTKYFSFTWTAAETTADERTWTFTPYKPTLKQRLINGLNWIKNKAKRVS